MKRFISNIMVIFVLLSLTCTVITGCSRGATSNTTTDKNESTLISMTGNVSETDKTNDSKAEMEKQKKAAEDAVKKTGGVSEAKIKEAVDYIETNLTDSTNNISSDTLRNLAYYGAYLDAIAKSKPEFEGHDLASYGENVYQYAYNIYTDTDRADSDASKALKNSIDKTMNTIKNAKDKLVSEVNEMFNRK